MTAGQMPETIMTGDTADMSQICQFGWYDWVMYYDNATLPDNRALLGRYLGPAIDVGSMLTAKILKPNGQYVCRLTLRHLDNNERNSEVHKSKQLEFDQAIDKKLGPKAKPIDFDEQDLTPEHIHYDKDADSIDSDHGDLEITPELGDNYIVKNRYQLNDVLFKSLETEKLATFIILAFILLIATFNIIGALTMLIIEKRKDIKTLYSLGADLTLIRNIFMREAFLISGIGALLGLLLGLCVCWLQLQFHLVSFGSEFVVPYYPIELQAIDFIRIFGLIMCISFFAALYPVRVFTRLDLVH
jgi:ABC-type antimicrobial peptide transport system permease subunit